MLQSSRISDDVRNPPRMPSPTSSNQIRQGSRHVRLWSPRKRQSLPPRLRSGPRTEHGPRLFSRTCSLTTSESGLTTTCQCHFDDHDIWRGSCLDHKVCSRKARRSMSSLCAPRCCARMRFSISSTPRNLRTEAIDQNEPGEH